MPSRWFHEILDLIAYGRSYGDLHRKKDAPYEYLGARHRIVNHDWYWALNGAWTMEDPFPDWLRSSVQSCAESKGGRVAERIQASHSHDYFDRVWDGLDRETRNCWEASFIWLLRKPDVLRDTYGVDVERGRIRRFVDGRDLWENAPELIGEYRRLRCYTEAVLRNKEELQVLLGMPLSDGHVEKAP